jgi:hypothetical protein
MAKATYAVILIYPTGPPDLELLEIESLATAQEFLALSLQSLSNTRTQHI